MFDFLKSDQKIDEIMAVPERRQEIMTEFSEMYFHFVMLRIQNMVDFKKEGRYAYEQVKNGDLFKRFINGEVVPDLNGKIDDDHPYAREIKTALQARHHYYKIINKNWISTSALICVPELEKMPSLWYAKDRKGKRKGYCEARSLFRYYMDFMYKEVVPAILSSYERMKVLHPEWIVNDVADIDDIAREYYNPALVTKVVDLMENIYTPLVYHEEDWKKRDEYNEKCSREQDREISFMMELPNKVASGEDVKYTYYCSRPFLPDVISGYSGFWMRDNFNEYGLILDNEQNLLEADIFPRVAVPEFDQIDRFLSCYRTVIGLYNKNDVYPEEYAVYDYVNKCPNLAIQSPDDVKDRYENLSGIIKFYIWSKNIELYCGIHDDYIKDLCLPYDKERWNLEPDEMRRIYMPDLNLYDPESLGNR